MPRNFEINISLFFSLGLSTAIAHQAATDTQPDQLALAGELRADHTRYQAFNEIRAIPAESVSPAAQLLAEQRRAATCGD